MNLSTFLILLVVVAVVGLVIRGMVKDKRAGKSTCGGDCSHCGSVCHAPKKHRNRANKRSNPQGISSS